MNRKGNGKGSRLIRMVNTFADQRDQVGLVQALGSVAEEFDCELKAVAEAIFPYISEYERSALFAMRDILKGAQFIYKCRVRRGLSASRMKKYRYRTFLAA